MKYPNEGTMINATNPDERVLQQVDNLIAAYLKHGEDDYLTKAAEVANTETGDTLEGLRVRDYAKCILAVIKAEESDSVPIKRMRHAELAKFHASI